jgi:hypothetical protein
MAGGPEIVGLKRAYERLQSLEIAYEYGPLRAYVDHKTALELWRTTIDRAVASVHETSHKTAAGTYIATAPSPWHAYFYLRAQQQFCFRSGRPIDAPSVETEKQIGEHLFFRGQRCASWDFKTSLSRRDSRTQECERRAVAALREYFGLTFAKDRDIASNTARCFAQHYGIATDLADISCDADIGVWFATHPVGEPCATPEGAVVRSVSWAGQENSARTMFLLPPPFVRNVYRQRGLFIDASSTGGQLTGNIMLDVRFPRETDAGEFQVIRGGAPIIVWPEPDEHEKELVLWAREIAAKCPNEDAVSKTVQSLRDAIDFPRFWLERELYDFESHVNAWLSIFDWILPATCVTAIPVQSQGSAPMRYEIAGPKVRALVRSNPTFFRAFVSASQGAEFSGFDLLRQIVTMARDELRRLGQP